MGAKVQLEPVHLTKSYSYGLKTETISPVVPRARGILPAFLMPDFQREKPPGSGRKEDME